MSDPCEPVRVPRWARRTGWVGLALLTACILVPFQRHGWSGSFPAVEYRFRFVGAEGRPVPDVHLDVLTRAGGRSHLYPIDEFGPGSPVASDADGRMTFHHRGLTHEYGGRTRLNLAAWRFTPAKHHNTIAFSATTGGKCTAFGSTR